MINVQYCYCKFCNIGVSSGDECNRPECLRARIATLESQFQTEKDAHTKTQGAASSLNCQLGNAQSHVETLTKEMQIARDNIENEIATRRWAGRSLNQWPDMLNRINAALAAVREPAKGTK